jgi:FixJ family two-component response regulator
MVMPELDGFDLVNWLVDQKTEAKLLIITGHNPLYAKAAQMQSAAKGVRQVKAFTKPVSVSTLRAALTY